jgi:YebC/PmpR family DNA-binding regulatory protein
MSGHSKWSQIKRKKAITDAKRGAHFTKLIREITVAARTGGGDPEMNARLRLAIDSAKAGNMPADNIERAIKKGTGELEGVAYEEITYEGYGPGGVALFIEAMTDNNNRTVSAVRHTLEKNGGNLGASGSVAWQFERKGQITVDATRFDEDRVLEAALTGGAEDVTRHGDDFLVTTQPADLHAVHEALIKEGLEVASAELAMVAKTSVDVSARDAEKLLKLLDALDDQDDVQKVHSNANIDEKVMAEAAAGM